ncbi:hypothetical protein RB195_009453 [Necator americanus]|uniref:Uncharacterized protein n=1 Tax=Necator americanus TaxID=51031 RepID=A0ABR1CTD7_NECAM
MLMVFSLILSSTGYGDANLGCKNMEGDDVDWFAAIKLPSKGDTLKGKGFVYFDTAQNDWKMSTEPVDSVKSAIGATVNQLYNIDKRNTFTIAYNDDSPVAKAESGRGHSKGVAVFNGEIGFWLIHSVPNFPPIKNYSFPQSGEKYAQSFLCLTLSVDMLEDVGQYMRFAQVTPFLSNLPELHKILAPSLVDVVNKKSLPRSATVFTTIRSIQTLGGKKAEGFSKHKKFDKDLWHDFIAPNLKTSMAVETWRSGGANDVGSQCGMKLDVYDISNVTVLGKSFANSQDHSKWGASMNSEVPAVCIGDVNRQVSQFKRGGGAVCIEDEKLWMTFYHSVAGYEDCAVPGN